MIGVVNVGRNCGGIRPYTRSLFFFSCTIHETQREEREMVEERPDRPKKKRADGGPALRVQPEWPARYARRGKKRQNELYQIRTISL